MQAIFRFLKEHPYNAGMPAGRPSKKARPLLGTNITKARKEKGFTQLELAQRLGMTQQGVAYLEREAISLKAEQLIELANALDTTIDFLVGREETNKARGNGPKGKAKTIFEAISKMPRGQQQKIFDIIEPFVKEHLRKKAS